MRARNTALGSSRARNKRTNDVSREKLEKKKKTQKKHASGAGGFGKVAQRNSEAGITPLFVDLRSSDVLCAALADLSGAKRLIKGLGTESLEAKETLSKGALARTRGS